MDAKITVVTQQEGKGFYLAQFKTAELAIYTYYLQSKGEALIIDPTFDTKIFKEFIDKRKSNLKYQLFTHYHADFISGHTELKVPLMMGPKAKKQINKFDVLECQDGSNIKLGQVSLKVIHTPGHTVQSTCFVLNDSDSNPVCVFTGDTLLVNDIGRSDVVANVEEKAAVHFDSLQKLKALDGKVRVYPCHGNGSSCGKNIGAAHFCDIATQKQKNNLFKQEKKEEFVKVMASGVSPAKYYSHVININQTGPQNFQELFQKANHPLPPQEFHALSQKLIVLDTRTQPESIIRGKNIFWLTARSILAAWVAGIVVQSPETQFIIFTQPDKWQDIADRLFRIGFFNIKGFNKFSMNQWKGESWKPRILRFDHLKDQKDATYLDCRNKPEWKSTGIIDKAVLIPLPQLQAKVLQMKDYKNIIVHCRTGMRARLAASILAQHGIQSSVLFQPVDQFKEKGCFNVVDFQE